MRGKWKGKALGRAITLETLELRRLMAANPSGFTQTFNYVENAPSVQLTGMDLSADDPSESLTATLTLADPAAGSIGGMSTNGGGHFDANAGVWTVTGDVYAVRFALQNLWFYPAANYDQNTSITTQVTDSNITGSIALNVDAAHHGPVMHHFIMPQDVTQGGSEDSGFAIYNQDSYGDGYGSGFAPYITDADAAPNDVLQLTIAASHTSLTLTDVTGLTFLTGDGTDDHTMVFTGTLADINNALDVVYGWQDADYSGWEHVLFTVYDLGLNGLGGSMTAQYSFDIEIEAWPDSPVSVAGSGQSAIEGALVQFDGSGSSDIDGDPLTYTWDFGDGTQGTGINPTHSYADEGVYTVTLTASDGTGWTEDGVSTLHVTVSNAAPTGTFIGSAVGVRGQTLGFSGNAADAGANDAIQVAWNFGDGQTIDFLPVSSSTLAPTHVYTAQGGFTVTMTLRDNANATTVFTGNLSIADVTLQPDPFDHNKTALFVGGTTGNDTILIAQASNGRLRATINGATNGKTYQPTGHIIVYALGGANAVDVADKITLDAALYGGSGKDTLDGGGGADILLGRKGNDKLIGRAGRDLLLGGAGSDLLDGGEGDDILVAGTWSAEYDDIALDAVMAEWTRPDHNYLQRVKTLRGDLGGLSGAYRLNASTVTDDAAADVLTGSGGREWFFATPLGAAKDAFTAAADEIVTAVAAG